MKLLTTLIVLPLLAAAVPVYKDASTGDPFNYPDLDHPHSFDKRSGKACRASCQPEWSAMEECRFSMWCESGERMARKRKAYNDCCGFH